MNELELANDDTFSPATTPADFEVSPETLEMIARSDADNTRAAYAKDWKKFEVWCEHEERTPLPATPETFAEYVTYLTQTPTERGSLPRPSTIDRVMGAIGRRHSDAGFKLDRRAASKAFKTYRRDWARAGNRQSKAAPVTTDVVRAMVESCDLTTLTGIRDRAVLLLGFALMARRSELCGLNIADLTEHAKGIIVLIRVSKTDQQADGNELAVRYGDDPTMCPIVATQAWLAALERRGVTSGPLFRRIDRYGRLGGTTGAAGRGEARMTGQSIQAIIQRAAQRARLPQVSGYKGHSLRAGGATAAAEAGAHTSSIAHIGRWSLKSGTVHGYVRAADMWENHPMKGVL